jgi:hypothetical protein
MALLSIVFLVVFIVDIIVVLVEEQQKTRNLATSQPRAHSPTSITKLAP